MLVAFLSKRLRMWLLLAIGAPVLAWLLASVGERIEARKGPSKISRALCKTGGWLRRRTKGPLARRDDRPS